MKKSLYKAWLYSLSSFKENPSPISENPLKWFPALLFSVGLTLFILIAINFVVASVGFLIGISISRYHFIFSTIISILTLFMIMKKFIIKKLILIFLLNILIVIILTVFSGFIADKFYDLNYDSQWYHIETIIALEKGWNPFWHSLTLKDNPDISSQGILNTYPRAFEIVEAVIYKFYGKIETAKSLNILGVFMAFLMVLSFHLKIKQLNSLISVLNSFLLVINPITLNQLLSFYIDGLMYNFILSLIALLLIMYLENNNNYLIVPTILFVCFLWNTKLTAIIISTLFFGAFLAFAWYTEKIKLFIKLIYIYVFAAFLAIFVFGANPYISNILSYGNPFYSQGRDANGYLYDNAPESLWYMPSVERFVVSIFSRTANLRAEGKIHQLKIPFTFNQDELHSSIFDNTVGGFGPLFSGIFILSIIGFGLIVIRGKFSFSRKSILYLLVVVLVSSIYFPVSSYARYNPCFWIFPCVVLVYNFNQKKILHRLVSVTMLITIVVNNWLIFSEYIDYNKRGSLAVKKELIEIKKRSNEKLVYVDFGLFRSNRVRFEETGIKFIERPISGCTSDSYRVLSNYIAESKIMLCY